jgi:hypothetical protein
LPASGYAGWSGDESAPTALSPSYFTACTTLTLASSLDEDGLQVGLKAGIAAIRFAAARLSDAMRVEQPSVGMVGHIPTALSLTATNVTQGVQLRVPESLNPAYAMVVGLPKLTTEAAVHALRQGVSPSRALLSQARYLTQSTNSPQPGMAILLAAVAAEGHAKELLPARKSPLAPSLRRLQRDYGSAVDLYGPVAKAMIGRSLEDDDPALWSDLESLFTSRNKMAHKLRTPSHTDAKQLVVAAMKAMDWLA